MTRCEVCGREVDEFGCEGCQFRAFWAETQRKLGEALTKRINDQLADLQAPAVIAEAERILSEAAGEA